jgi:parallel beta-helix repeat protein
VSVKAAAYGAKGDGVTDDTTAIQNAINAVGGTGGTVLVPDGVYMVNATAIQSGGNHGLALKSAMTLKLSPGAVLKAIPNAVDTYAIVMLSGLSDVSIVGGTIEGERKDHMGSAGESGMGISIESSQNVVVEALTAKECWGDGFYVSGTSKKVTFCGVTSDHNRRQGMSIVGADGVLVQGSTFQNTTGTLPEAGIDIEPNPGETVNDVLIQACTFINNAGGAFQTGVPDANTGKSFVTLVVFDGNTVTGNGVGPVGGGYRMALQVTNSDGTKLTNNILDGNTGEGIRLTDNATHTVVSGNTVKATKLVVGSEYWTGVGILISTAAGSSVTANTVTGNEGHGIWQLTPDPSVTISGNTDSGNALTP